VESQHDDAVLASAGFTADLYQLDRACAAAQPLLLRYVRDVFGAFGNTGKLYRHIHAQRLGTALEPFSGSPLPVSFKSRVLVRNDGVSVPSNIEQHTSLSPPFTPLKPKNP
jgi:hypothetical protein